MGSLLASDGSGLSFDLVAQYRSSPPEAPEQCVVSSRARRARRHDATPIRALAKMEGMSTREARREGRLVCALFPTTSRMPADT